MGQGQAEIAMQLLHECSRSGEWLCLKNLHLVTAWLPSLEKVSRICPGSCPGLDVCKGGMFLVGETFYYFGFFFWT